MSIEQSLDRLATATEAILAKLSGATVTVGKPSTPSTPSTPAGAGKAADKAAADKPAAAGKPATAGATAGKPAAPKPPAGKAPTASAAPTKAPNGKWNSSQVREALRAVSANPALGKQAARDIISEDGGGATTFIEVKPEYFDAIYEACQVQLTGEGGGAGKGAVEEEDEFA